MPLIFEGHSSHRRGTNVKKFWAIGILFLFIGLSHAWALPSVPAAYAKDYAKIRKELQFSELKDMRDGYRRKNSFLREWSHPQSTQIEIYLADVESGYGFLSPESSREELERLIEHNLDPKNKMPSAEKELVLGDAYHWLGHVYEEKGEFIKAYESYIRSHVHYQKTPLKKSPRINDRLIVQEHGEFHLKKSQKPSSYSYLWQVSNLKSAPQCSTDFLSKFGTNLVLE